MGDRYVVEAMRAGGYNVGGEQSGHLVFLDASTTGDGLVAALQVLAIMLREDKPLSHLADSAMTRVPQVLKNASFPRKLPLAEMPQLSRASALVEKKLGKKGRLLVRWSGTEPKLRVMLEGEDTATIGRLADELIAAAKRDLAETDE